MRCGSQKSGGAPRKVLVTVQSGFQRVDKNRTMSVFFYPESASEPIRQGQSRLPRRQAEIVNHERRREVMPRKQAAIFMK
jgi:hypothetical protein